MKLLVTKEFIELSDKLIAGIKNIKLVLGNGNVLLAKPPVEEKTKGGIILAEAARELESKQAGFARVIAIPTNLDPLGGDIDIKPGDFVFYTYVADNPIYYKAISQLIGVDIPKETLYYTSDSEIIAKITL